MTSRSLALAPSERIAAPVEQSIRRTLHLGNAIAVVLVFGIGGWAAFTEIAGATLAPGQLVVESDV